MGNSKNKFTFVNPYNFMPLQDAEPSRGDTSSAQDTEKTFTGVIHYSIRTVTPLFIPNTSNSDAFHIGVTDHKSYDFFSYADLSGESSSTEKNPKVPVIPGSELRGMIRSYYEMITNSCLSVVEDNEVLSKRTQEKFKPGLIKKHGTEYELYDAELYLMRTKGENSKEDTFDWSADNKGNEPRVEYGRKCYIQKDLPEGGKVYFQIRKRKNKNGYSITPLALKVSKTRTGESTSEGFVLKGEKGPDMSDKKRPEYFQKNNKHCCHIIALKQNSRCIGKVDLSVLDKVLKIYKDNGDNTYKEYRENLDAYKKNGADYFPVYYSKVENTVGRSEKNSYILLSPACITRDVHKNTLTDILNEQSHHAPCDRVDALCPACKLFGTVIQGKNHGIKASSVRFSDLRLNNIPVDLKELFLDPTTLMPMSSPRISNTEYYLKRPSEDSWFWTYDYYVDKDGRLTIQPGEINGRKIYWHHMIGDSIPSAEPGNLNVTIHPLRRGIEFSGEVYFDRITKTELDRLIFLMNAGCEGGLSDKKHGYKLGMGKPLGLGSIAVKADSVLLRKVSVSPSARTITLSMDEPYTGYEEPVFSDKENFKKLTMFEFLENKKVSYPYAVDPSNSENSDAAIFEWFANNHDGFDHRKNRITPMVQTRNDMFVRQYMKAMNPEFGYVVIPGDGSSREKSFGFGSNMQKTNNASRSFEKNRKRPVADQQYSGRIIGANDNGYWVIVSIDGEEQKVRIYFKNTFKRVEYGKLLDAFPEGASVIARFEGKETGGDGKERDRWTIVG